MKDMIGRRIKDERTRQNLTQDELIKEAQLDWERQTLGQVENGERELKAWELAKISQVLRMDMSSFFPRGETPAKQPFVLWRQQPENHTRLEAEFIRLCKDYKFVEDLNSVDVSDFRKLPRKKIDLRTFKYPDAYALAEEIRSDLDLGDYPATVLVKILEEKFGVKLFFNELDGHGSAAASASDYGQCILISSNEPAWRQHFSIAHELFHIITWDDGLLEQVSSDKKLWNKNESLANAFAAGLLVPTEALHRAIRSLPKLNDAGIVSMARQFEVSLEALLWRMSHLDIINSDIAKKTMDDQQIRALDQESRAEAQTPYYLSNRFVRMAYVAYENGEISRARLAKILSQSLSALPSYLKNSVLQKSVIMKSRLVILDANVIIRAFERGFWNSLANQYEVHITSIVLHNEVYYYEDKNGQQIPIDLTADIRDGKVKELSATPDEIDALVDKVNPNFMDRIDDGEQEALALLITGRYDGFRYCTGDTRAIKALASLNLGALGISLEELLAEIGQKNKLPDPSYSKAAFERKKAEGLQEQASFLKKKP